MHLSKKILIGLILSPEPIEVLIRLNKKQRTKMFKVTREQMLSIKANKRAEYIEKLIPKFKELKPEFLPEKDEDIKKLFDAKILESAK